MGKIYIGDANGISREVKKIYVGDANGIAREVKQAYVGDANGLAREIYKNEVMFSLKFTSSGFVDTSGWTRSSVPSNYQTANGWYYNYCDHFYLGPGNTPYINHTVYAKCIIKNNTSNNYTGWFSAGIDIGGDGTIAIRHNGLSVSEILTGQSENKNITSTSARIGVFINTPTIGEITGDDYIEFLFNLFIVS